MKVLFVLQGGQFIYGANRSIEILLKKLDYNYDLMICKSFTISVNEEEIRERFGKHLKNIYVCWVPRYRCHMFDKRGVMSEISHIVNNVMAFLFSWKRNKIFKKNEYSYIHLNSLVLYPMINKKNKYIIHAREVINADYLLNKRLIYRLKMALGVIYIDSATKEAIECECHGIKGLILNNPFDMTYVAKKNHEECLKRYGLEDGKVIYAMLGQIEKSKGSDLVLKAFHSTNVDSYLLIVGANEHAYARELQELYKEDTRIKFCGEEIDTSYIYCICDYVIRGENQFCIGRTIYEGLYAGCSVIIPGVENDLDNIPNYEVYKEQIIFYNPSDIQSLAKRILICATKKMVERKYRTNIPEYLELYYKFVNKFIFSSDIC